MKLPCSLLATDLALFLPTAVLVNLGGIGGKVEEWGPPSCSKVNDWRTVFALRRKDRHRAGRPFLLVMARIPESRWDFRQRGLQKTHRRAVGFGAGEDDEEWRVPRNHHPLQRLKSEVTQEPPPPSLLVPEKSNISCQMTGL